MWLASMLLTTAIAGGPPYTSDQPFTVQAEHDQSETSTDTVQSLLGAAWLQVDTTIDTQAAVSISGFSHLFWGSFNAATFGVDWGTPTADATIAAQTTSTYALGLLGTSYPIAGSDPLEVDGTQSAASFLRASDTPSFLTTTVLGSSSNTWTPSLPGITITGGPVTIDRTLSGSDTWETGALRVLHEGTEVAGGLFMPDPAPEIVLTYEFDFDHSTALLATYDADLAFTLELNTGPLPIDVDVDFPLTDASAALETSTGLPPATVEVRHPVPWMADLPIQIDAGSAPVGVATAISFDVTNHGLMALDGAVSWADDLSGTTIADVVVAPGGTQTITLDVAPTAIGPQTATLSVTTNDPWTPYETIDVAISGIDPCEGIGDADGDGICDDVDFMFGHSPVIAGGPMWVVAYQGTPGDYVGFVGSLGGPGTTCFAGVDVCADLDSAFLVAVTQADAEGIAWARVDVPAWVAPGTPIAFQAISAGAVDVASNVSLTTVR